MASSLFLRPVDENEIIVAISKLKNNCAPGPDGITTTVIKSIHEYIVTPLTHIINLCYTNGNMPTQWKESNVTPIYKAGNRNNVENYRPISVINSFAKIFEQTIKVRLIEFVDKHHVISPQQFGFVNGSSTEDAVLDFIKHTVEALDESLKCLAVFVDLAKAFDTVSHSLLLNKLSDCGVRGHTLKLFEDYLFQRKQRVKIGDKFSTSSFVTGGVPQGTVLGPILFLVYINSLTQIVNFQGHIVCYADDTAIVFKGKSWKEVHNNAETNMQKFQCWLNNGLLSMNMDKTKYMKFSLISSEHPTEMKFHIHKNTCNNKNGNNCSCPSIEKAETVRYLGILIDHHLRWDKQTSNVAERLRLLLYKFYRLRDILSRKNLLIVYKALAESIIQYCIMVWGGTFNNSLRHLQTTQNSIIKIIFRKERLFPTDQLYLETGILNVRSIYSYQCLKWMF